jgi:hypothetical protein
VIQRHGLGALKEIDTHTLENLTLGDITDPATLPAIEAELEERQLICAGAAVSRGILYR